MVRLARGRATALVTLHASSRRSRYKDGYELACAGILGLRKVNNKAEQMQCDQSLFAGCSRTCAWTAVKRAEPKTSKGIALVEGCA